MKKYRANAWNSSIVEVEVTKETQQFVWPKGRRRSAKESNTCAYKDSYRDAKSWLQAHFKLKLEKAKEATQEYQSMLEKVNEL